MSGVRDSVILREQAERRKLEEKRRQAQEVIDAHEAAEPFFDHYRRKRDLAQVRRGALGSQIEFTFLAADGFWTLGVPWNQEMISKGAVAEAEKRKMECDPLLKSLGLIKAGNDYYDELLEEEEREREADLAPRRRPRWRFWRRRAVDDRVRIPAKVPPRPPRGTDSGVVQDRVFTVPCGGGDIDGWAAWGTDEDVKLDEGDQVLIVRKQDPNG